MEIARSAEHQNRMEEKKLLDISRNEKYRDMQESWARTRIAADNERLRRELAETKKQHNCTGELKPTDQTKQYAARESWGKLKAEAEGRRQISYETRRQSCSHSALGLLKWKGKGQCDICKVPFVKQLYRCADCGFIACWKCKTAN
jgi:hypothetical protein